MGKKKEAKQGGSNQYEAQREQRIADNKRRVGELGLQQDAAGLAAEAGQPAAKRPKQGKQQKEGKRQQHKEGVEEPSRRSGRARKEVQYAEPTMKEVMDKAPQAKEKEALPEYNPPASASSSARVLPPTFDASEGERDAQGRLVFEDAPEFRPNLTPKQVIQAGAWGGVYFNPTGGKPGIRSKSVDIDHKEFPTDWFEGLPRKAYRARIYTVGTNKYGVKAGQDQAYWESKDWINPQDPRGWFHWYCRFYQGRRSDDDARQISRWKGVVGDKGRWLRRLVNMVIRQNKRWDDANVSPVIRQTLLHWAFELTEDEFERMRGHL